MVDIKKGLGKYSSSWSEEATKTGGGGEGRGVISSNTNIYPRCANLF